MTKVLTMPEHVSCKNHQRYWLTCDQYEELIELSGNRCQACRQPARECSPHRKLYIDHDQDYGIWAVRGLLCPRCNASLRTDWPDPGWAMQYLGNPWFRPAFAAMGVSIERMPEPPVGSIFRSPRGTTWKREPQRWQNQSFARATRCWAGMSRDFSPLHLRHVQVASRQPREVSISLWPHDAALTADAIARHLTPDQRREVALLLASG